MMKNVSLMKKFISRCILIVVFVLFRKVNLDHGIHNEIKSKIDILIRHLFQEKISPQNQLNNRKSNYINQNH
jgi:hypothetical protein